MTVLLAVAAACQADERQPSPERSGRPAPAAAAGFTLVATGAILPHSSVIDRAAFDAGGAGGAEGTEGTGGVAGVGGAAGAGAAAGGVGGLGGAGGVGYDFRPMLEGVKPVVSPADLALCHLGTVFGAPGAQPDVKSPPEIARALAATGYDGCSTASAHSLDDGAPGVQHTLDALDGAGVRHAGTARTEAEAGAVALLRAGPARVAQLAYTSDAGGQLLPVGQPWAVRFIDAGRVLADARAARKAGADVVVVSLHWGTAWQDTPDERQLALARALTASRSDGRPDIDLILGAGAHVPQPYEKVNGTWVVYGLGDQIAGETTGYQGVQDPRGNQSTVARLTFAPPVRPGGRWEVRKAEFLPQMFDVDAGRVVDLNKALAAGAGVQGPRDRIRDLVLSRGAVKDGLVMGE
ncbi:MULTISPECIES: CapA family protein [Streptomyces]|uniref:CapA family protein n=2 Tax=Streptomyces TaxID=1883 RepID=A0ABV9J553_9ACTN